jgi:hypothetical protein
MIQVLGTPHPDLLPKWEKEKLADLSCWPASVRLDSSDVTNYGQRETISPSPSRRGPGWFKFLKAVTNLPS